VASFTGINHITVTGNLVGGEGRHSGAVGSGGFLAQVEIGGTLTGGLGNKSASILVAGNLGSAETGSITGGSGKLAATIAVAGTIGFVKVNGDLRGSVGLQSGAIGSDTRIESAIVTGSIIGGFGEQQRRNSLPRTDPRR
jgi:hypothetical protein